MDRASFALQRQHADGDIAVADGDLRGMHRRVAGADADGALRADPGGHVRHRAVPTVIERVATKQLADLVIARDAVAVRDLIAAVVVHGQRECRRVDELADRIAEHPPDIAGTAGCGDELAMGRALIERALEVAAPSAEALFVTVALALGDAFVIAATLVQALLEALLKIGKHLFDAANDAVGAGAPQLHGSLDGGAALLGPLRETLLFLCASGADPFGETLLFLEPKALDGLLHHRLGVAQAPLELLLEHRFGFLDRGLTAYDGEAGRCRCGRCGLDGPDGGLNRRDRGLDGSHRDLGECLFELDAVGEARVRLLYRFVRKCHTGSLFGWGSTGIVNLGEVYR